MKPPNRCKQWCTQQINRDQRGKRPLNTYRIVVYTPPALSKPLQTNQNFQRIGNTYATRNLTPGLSVYGERRVTVDMVEWRIWHPKASKLAAALSKGLLLNLSSSARVLYLGASTGTTVSHLSDLCPQGLLFALDNAPRVVRELVFLSETRPNIAPLLADARLQQDYALRISMVDWIYQDIAAREQISIFLNNTRSFLKPGGRAILCLKARSVDFARKPVEVFADAAKALSEHLVILQRITLEPHYKDHCLFVCG